MILSNPMRDQQYVVLTPDLIIKHFISFFSEMILIFVDAHKCKQTITHYEHGKILI